MNLSIALPHDAAVMARPRRTYRCAALAMLVLSAGCASPPHRVQFEGSRPLLDCPKDLDHLFSVSAESLPVSLPANLARDVAGAISGQHARRIVVSIAARRPLQSERIVWSALSLSTFGGTFSGWTGLQTQHTVVNAVKPAANEPLSPLTRREPAETASVVFAPGEIKVVRSARGKTDLSGTLALDVVVTPGGTEVDDTVMRVAKLWTPEGAPLSPSVVEFELVSARHPPGYDVVDASAELEFVVRRSNGDEWGCALETRATLVDQDAVRQPLWDIGVASSSNGRRNAWLALSDPARGVIRLIFESPSAANAFAHWVKATGANGLGRYSLGVIQPTIPRTQRPFAPIDLASLQTFRPLAADEFSALKIGALGEN